MYLATETLAGVSVAFLFFMILTDVSVEMWENGLLTDAGGGAGEPEACEAGWDADPPDDKRQGEILARSWQDLARLGQTKRHDFEGHAFCVCLVFV